MDVFIEYMVKKQNSPKDILLKILYALAAGVILVGALLLIPVFAGSVVGQFVSMLAPLLGFGAVFGAWYLITSMNVEYEYILTNGEMDVDKIIARRRRKRMITANARHFELFEPYKPQGTQGKDCANMVYACISPDHPGNYCAVFNHPTLGSTLLVFTPNDRVLEGLRSFAPRQAGGRSGNGSRPGQD